MSKNNRGVALVYTTMIMLFVFAICAVITSTMLMQKVSSDSYADSAANERIYLQIGELFYSTGGAFDSDESGTSPFVSALIDSDFSVDNENRTVSYGSYKFSLSFAASASISTLTIKNIGGSVTYLTVGIDTDTKTIVEWTKGNG